MPSLSSDLTVAITGASAGIGAAVARRFSQDGAKLILIARSREPLDALASELGNAESVPLDISRPEEIEDFFAQMPLPDVWVNNAGLARGLPLIDDVSRSDIDSVIDTNLKGALYASRKVVAGMRARGTGHIVNITSAAAFNPYRGGNLYAVSKAGLHMLTQCLRQDLGGTPIRVTEIAPGIVGDTEFSYRRFQGDMARYNATYRDVKTLSAEDIADAVHFCVSAPEHVNVELMLIYPVQQHGGSGKINRMKEQKAPQP